MSYMCLKIDKYNQHPRYKAKLVVKGFSQIKGIDFHEIFTPIFKMTSIKIVLGLTTYLNLKIEQMDVKTTFLYGNLEEEICIGQPEVFIKENKEYVSKLKKNLNGLKQALSQWYKKYDAFMREQTYKQCT